MLSASPPWRTLALNPSLHSDSFVKAALGTTSFGGVSYTTTAETLEGVMVDGTTGVNHGKTIVYWRIHYSCKTQTDIAIDGNAVLLTIRIN